MSTKVSSAISVARRRRYLDVLEKLAEGDRLGPPFHSEGTSTARRFVRSGQEHPQSLIDDMTRHELLDLEEDEDGEERIVMAVAGRQFLEEHGAVIE